MIRLSGFAQPDVTKKTDPKITLSFTYDQSQSHNYLFTVERSLGKNALDWNYSGTFQLGYSHINSTIHDHFVKGDGASFYFGVKVYLDEFAEDGWNLQNAIELGGYNNNGNNYYVQGYNNGYSGFYSFSFINPTLGYKFMVGKMAIEPYLGGSWSFIFYRNGDGNHNNFGYLTPKFGLRIGFLTKS